MDSTTSSSREREQRFRELYDSAYVDLLRFACRRVGPVQAEDVVGEAMLIAWRRLDDVPADLSGARAWLFGVARKTIQNSRRREEKHGAVAVHLAHEQTRTDSGGQFTEFVLNRVDLAVSWPLLSVAHREAIALSVLDGLSAPEAAAVLGISATAFRLRLSRARRALRHLVAASSANDQPPAAHAHVRSSR